MGRLVVLVAVALALGLGLWLGLGDGLGLDTTSELSSEESSEALLADDPTALVTSGTQPSKAERAKQEAAQRAAAEAAAAVSSGFRVIGKVVDEKRAPKGGVSVQVLPKGQSPVDTITQDDGTFVVGIEEPTVDAMWWQPRSMAIARTADGFAGAAYFTTAVRGDKKEFDAGAIILRKGAAIPIHVASSGSALPEAPVWVLNSRGLTVHETKTDTAGNVTTPLLPAGAYVVVAKGITPPQARGAKRVSLPRKSPDEPVEIEVVDERLLDVLVIDKETDRPIAGATVVVGDGYGALPPRGGGYMPPLPPAVTDAEGRATVRGIADDGQRLQVTATAEGYPPTQGWGNFNQVRVKKTDTEVELKLQAYREVRFPLGNGEAEAPKDGEALTATRTNWYGGKEPEGTPPLVARVEKGYVHIDGLKPQWDGGTVRTEDGRFASFNVSGNKDEGNTLEFSRAAAIQVRLLDAEGKPVVGAQLTISSNQNGWSPMVMTDDKGETTFQQVTWKTINVKHIPAGSSNWWQAPVIDKFKREEIDGIREIRLKPSRDITLAIRIDGQSRLPPAYHLRVNNRQVNSKQVQEDPDAATLTFPLPARHAVGGAAAEEPDEYSFMVRAEGCLTKTEKVSAETVKSGAPVRVDLLTAGSLLCRYTPPEDGSLNLNLEKWNPESEAWQRNRGRGWRRGRNAAEVQEENTKRFDGLDAGRYRVSDWQSKVASEPVDVVLGQATPEVLLDLSTVLTTEGTVEVPDGYTARGARIKRVGEGSGSRGNIGVNAKTGTWRTRAPRGEPMTLEVWHPLLSPAATGGRVTLKGGDRGVALRLEATTLLTFKAPQLKANTKSAPGIVEYEEFNGAVSRVYNGRSNITVHFYRAGDLENVVKQTWAAADGDLYRMGGVEPGTYSIRMQAGNLAPLVLQSVKVSAGTKDLGVLQFSEGSKIRVHVRPSSEGEAVPHCWVSCRYLGKPPYYRNGGRGKSGEPIEVTGLGAGRWRITVHANQMGGGQAKPLLDEEIDVDGSSIIERACQAP